MAVTKRTIGQSQDSQHVHQSRRFLVPDSNPKQPKKPRLGPPKPRKQVSASSVNAIKKKIRDVTRRLQRSHVVSAETSVEDERALNAYQQELADAEAEKIRQKMISKYHMVRFFERQKATRILKKLKKRVQEAVSTEESELLKKRAHAAEVDLNYTLYHPLSEMYLSLYPPGTLPSNPANLDEDIIPIRPPIWLEVEQAMADGTLEKLRNRGSAKPVVTSKPLVKTHRKTKPELTPVDTTGLNRRQRRSLHRDVQNSGKFKPASQTKNHASETTPVEDNEDNDDGFFEV
ncbi:hypothetical protein BGHDH14_bgh03711 [Blumeria hordei DH14]|uniref:rRNA-processing protein EFG1 n=1 Tax=Blumeria graminis f. sp. hordei (strain DH14) TaxID=546991 RepID=N1JCP7_BLUG1|nr:hypothetical protein BGHDH14_bgh03711 [Blumeria hordei DH14]